MKRVMLYLIIVSVLLSPAAAFGMSGHPESRDPSTVPLIEPPPFTVKARAGVLLEPGSGLILVNQGGETSHVPASLAKIMTLRLAQKALTEGRIRLTDEVTVSREAWAQTVGGSLMFLEPGAKVKVDDLLKGIAIVSGNDACVAIAELVGGSVEGFVAMMNEEAQSLGLSSAHFVDPHGLSPQNRISALDMAKLSAAYIKEFPEALAMHSTLSFTYNGITQQNRNGLLGVFPGVDGLKTGNTDEAGFNLVVTASQGPMRLIAVVMGSESIAAREQEAALLLGHGFNKYVVLEQVKAGEVQGSLEVLKGAAARVDVVAEHPVNVLLPRRAATQLDQSKQIQPRITAPLTKGQPVGELIFSFKGQELGRTNLVAADDVPRGNWLRVIWDTVRQFFRGLFKKG